MEWAAVISAALGIAALVLKAWLEKAPKREQEKRNDEIQEGRQDIATGNADAVSARIDSVCGQRSGDTPILGNDEDTARRIAKITGQ